jgi:hypothetical protein
MSTTAALVALGLLISVPAGAQPTGTLQELERQYEAAFEETFKDPGNLDRTFRYAELAVEIGNFEAAISALERMLLINPNLPRVRLELGVLYFRLGSYQLARTYLLRALEGDPPADVRANVEKFLAEIDNRLSRYQVSGSIYGGWRVQTNANAGPTSTAVRANGVAATLADENTDQGDSNFFVSGNVNHVYDLLTQNGMVIETNAIVFGSEQKDQKQLDLLFLSVNSGPRAKMLTSATYRPYVVGNVVRLEDVPYLRSFGLGINLTNQFSSTFSGEFNAERLEQSFSNNGRRATVTDQDGAQTEVRLRGRYRYNEDVQLSLGATAVDGDADRTFEATREYGVSLGATSAYSPRELVGLPNGGSAPWVTALTGARNITDYGAGNPSVDTNIKRFDKEWRFTLVHSIQLQHALTLIATVQRTYVDSNISNFSYNNSLLSVGASWRF